MQALHVLKISSPSVCMLCGQNISPLAIIFVVPVCPNCSELVIRYGDSARTMNLSSTTNQSHLHDSRLNTKMYMSGMQNLYPYSRQDFLESKPSWQKFCASPLSNASWNQIRPLQFLFKCCGFLRWTADNFVYLNLLDGYTLIWYFLWSGVGMLVVFANSFPLISGISSFCIIAVLFFFSVFFFVADTLAISSSPSAITL